MPRPRDEQLARLAQLVSDLRELERDAEANDMGSDRENWTAWAADVARRAIAALDAVLAAAPPTGGEAMVVVASSGWTARAPSTVGERWDDVDVGHGVLYGKCPRCGVARICEWCPPPCNTQSARYARGQRMAVPERIAEKNTERLAAPPEGGEASKP
jgi:hypothetical protein